MILMFMGCFSIVSEDFNSWKKGSETGLDAPYLTVEISEISAGTFRMGCTEDTEGFPADESCADYEYPTHEM